MDGQLESNSAIGRQFLVLCESHASDFATRAAQHDREASFPFENIEATKVSGLAAATVPKEFGGMGLVALRDLIVGVNRLGRGDGSTALAVNMHLMRVWLIARGWRALAQSGDTAGAAILADTLHGVVAGKVIISALASEAGTDLLYPKTEAIRTADGWRLTGHKIFATGSPAATTLGVTCRFMGPDGQYRMAGVNLPSDTPGVDMKNNWDALGMRGSGSQDVGLTDCFVPAHGVVEAGAWGSFSSRFLGANLAISIGLVAVFLGVAEAARDLVVDLVRSRSKAGGGMAARYAIQHTVAEIEIDLAAARAILERHSSAVDAMFASHSGWEIPLATMHTAMKDFQCAKWFVTRKAIEIVDRAMTASGGSGYFSKSPLSRLYRDVRAGPFMQPFSPNEAFEYIGKVALGVEPTFN